jgi:hypothetical protein
MARKSSTRNRPQTSKGREVSLRVRQVQGLRFSNAAGPHISGARFDRNTFRAQAQRGNFDYEG